MKKIDVKLTSGKSGISCLITTDSFFPRKVQVKIMDS